MSVIYITTVKRFIGLSTDTKPTTDVPPGSTFYAWDTNIMFICYDGTNWTPKDVKSFVTATTFDMHQGAASYDLYTATTGDVYVERFTFTLPNVDCSDDAALTGISIQSDSSPVVTLLAAASGVKANLTANAAFVYSTPFNLPVTKKIQITIIGGTATADPTTCTVTCRFTPVIPGAYLAV